VVKKITALLDGGGYFLLPFLRAFHAAYAAHTMPRAPMSETSSDSISYNDKGLTPFTLTFGGYWLTVLPIGRSTPVYIVVGNFKSVNHRFERYYDEKVYIKCVKFSKSNLTT